MKTTELSPRSPSRLWPRIKGNAPQGFIADNRPEAARQAGLIAAIQRKSDLSNRGAIQRVPVGTGDGTDNDRINIQVRDIEPETDHRMRVQQGHYYDPRARVNRPTNDTLLTFQEGSRQLTAKLKHYMVVKNGTCYQFPVKYFYQPIEEAPLSWQPDNRHPPLPGAPALPAEKTFGDRGYQPEGFGGNQDWNRNIQNGTWGAPTLHVEDSRNSTLAHEYLEEARLDGERIGVYSSDDPAAGRHYQASDKTSQERERDIKLKIEKSKFFHATYPRPPKKNGQPNPPTLNAGTLSIVSSTVPLQQRLHPAESVPERGMAEMAGTIVIDCAPLIQGPDIENDALEHAVGNLLVVARNSLLEAAVPAGLLADPFASSGGILAHLVGMVADDILFQRATLAAQEAHGEGEHEEEQNEVDLTEIRHEEEQEEEVQEIAPVEEEQTEEEHTEEEQAEEETPVIPQQSWPGYLLSKAGQGVKWAGRKIGQGLHWLWDLFLK